MVHQQTRAGAVAIGRNEGRLLGRCLESIARSFDHIVYVDSGSTDGSPELARSMGVEVIELDPAMPFTAARARNEGYRRLREIIPQSEYVQFVDGDCELCIDWLEVAVSFLDEHRDTAVVCGRLRERHPERSIYNMLCDIEWDAPPGESKACGGNALYRVEAFSQAGGYRPDLIAGEEPELCVRLRAAGWKIWRSSAPMAVHDSEMTRFSQWWTRCVRGGYAYAQSASLHGSSPGAPGVRESASAWFWGLGLPLCAAALAPLSGYVALIVLLLYPAQVCRIASRGARTTRENWWHAAFLVLGKIPEVIGQSKFHIDRRFGRQSHHI